MRFYSLAGSLLLAVGSAWAAPEFVQPTDNLVLSGIPPIPATLPEEVRRYTEGRAASLASWHPVRREVLISTRFGNTSQLHHVKMPGGARSQLTFFTEPVYDAEYQPADGRYFLFSKDVGGNEFSQIYRYDCADGRSTLLTDGGRSQNGGWEWSTAKNRVVYASTRRNGADRDFWVMDPEDPKSDRLLAALSGGGWSVSDWSQDDAQILVRERISVSRSHLWVMDTLTGEKTRLTGEDEHVSYENPTFSVDGKGVFLATDKGSEFSHLAYLDLATKEITPLTAEIPWDVEDFDLSPDGRTIAFVVNDAGISRLYLLDVATRKYAPVAGLVDGVSEALKWHQNSREVGLTLASARSTSDVYSVNVESREVTRWTESELGGMVASELSEPELVRWKSFDGREISGFYYRAHSRFSGKRPVMIDIHGGPESQSRPWFQGRDNYFLNEMGISIIYPNVRGSTGYGKSFEKLDNGKLREDSVRDIGALLDWIPGRPELDASRVMVSGGSYGGYMSLATAVHYGGRLRCALDLVGISHFGTFLKNTESYRRALRRVEYGDETDPEMAAFFDRISPLNNAQKIKIPLFVVQGGNDPRVPLSEAEQIVARVKEQGTPVWYLMAKDEGHGFAKKNNRDFYFYSLVLFLREHLLGEPAH